MTTSAMHHETTTWRDGKRWLWLLSPLLPLAGLTTIALAAIYGIGALYWALPIIFYGLVPLLDYLIGVDRVNPPESAVTQLSEDRFYRGIVYAYIPTQYAATILGAFLAVQGGLVWWEMLGLVIAVGMVNGIGINTAHELGHKTNSLERWLAKLTLAPVAYGHFFIEHNKGHHKNVATPEDPASSRMGESFWGFLPRTMIGSLRSAWNIEKARLQRLGKSPWTLENENLQAWAMTVILFGGLTVWLGWPALAFLAVQAFYGASLLEVINYIEHYGLLRQKLPSGRYERCNPSHSWNSNHVVTNLFLYQLQRHADHHANPTRRFQALRHFDDSPQLPSGYASMLLLAYFPPLWFRQIDRLVFAHYDGDLTKANVLPSKRAKLIAQWQGTPLDDGHPDPFPGEHDNAAATAFAEGESSRHQCTDCGYVYDEREGCPHEGFPPGTRWAEVPDDWACPQCAVRDKVDFRQLAA